MGFEGKAFCLKLCVLCFTFLFWVLGAAIFGICLWLRLDFWSNHYIVIDSVLKIYHIAIYIALAVGGLIIIFGIIGCVGAIASRLVPLVLFLVFLVLIFLLEVAGVAYCCVMREEFQNTISEGEVLKTFIKDDYGRIKGKTKVIDYMQWKLQCCGGQGYNDYIDSYWMNSNEKHKDQVPLSCCRDYIANKSPSINSVGCSINSRDDNLIHKRGCGHAIVNLVEQHLLPITGIVIAILALQLFGFLFIVLLICYLRRPPPQQPDDVVYEMARTQEKAPYPTRGNTYSNL